MLSPIRLSSTSLTFSTPSCLARVARTSASTSAKGCTLASLRSSILMMCRPNWLRTGSEIWPGCRAQAASSKGFTVWPRWIQPSSPPGPAALGPLLALATAAKSPFSASLRMRAAFSMACFTAASGAFSARGTRMWATLTCSGWRKRCLLASYHLRAASALTLSGRTRPSGATATYSTSTRGWLASSALWASYQAPSSSSVGFTEAAKSAAGRYRYSTVRCWVRKS